MHQQCHRRHTVTTYYSTDGQKLHLDRRQFHGGPLEVLRKFQRSGSHAIPNPPFPNKVCPRAGCRQPPEVPGAIPKKSQIEKSILCGQSQRIKPGHSDKGHGMVIRPVRVINQSQPPFSPVCGTEGKDWRLKGPRCVLLMHQSMRQVGWFCSGSGLFTSYIGWVL